MLHYVLLLGAVFPRPAWMDRSESTNRKILFLTHYLGLGLCRSIWLLPMEQLFYGPHSIFKVVSLQKPTPALDQ
jgi:hypothetical protein